MNYARTFQHTSTIVGLVSFPVRNRSLNAEMYGHNSLHPAYPMHNAHNNESTSIIPSLQQFPALLRNFPVLFGMHNHNLYFRICCRNGGISRGLCIFCFVQFDIEEAERLTCA